MAKSTVEEIRARFDADVERFSNLETGQAAAMDSPLHMDLLTEAAAAVTPHAVDALDIGCGAGNYALKLAQRLPRVRCHLIDLSQPMLDRAQLRLHEAGVAVGEVRQGDINELDLGEQRYDLVLAAQCLHHLRSDADWERVFAQVFASLRPGGSFWVADSLEYHHRDVRDMMWRRWGAYLTGLRDEAYRDHVLAYVEKEDTPRPLVYQLELMRRVGFEHVDVLHVNSRFGSFGGVKGRLA